MRGRREGEGREKTRCLRHLKSRQFYNTAAFPLPPLFLPYGFFDVIGKKWNTYIKLVICRPISVCKKEK
jgi:hypothetical protein